MKPFRKLAQAVAGAAFACTAAIADPAPIELTPDEAYLAAVYNMQQGREALSYSLADALLQRNPGDFRTLVLKSQAALSTNRLPEAVAAGQLAWRAASDGSEKYTAAMVTAQALNAEGKKTRAQLWLRRATDVAPDAGARALATRDFRFVRAQNPWLTQLSFNISPTDNVNNGSIRDSVRAWVYGVPIDFVLSGAAQALEGVEYSTGIATRYRFAQGGHHAHDLVMQFNHRTYSLTADAKAQAPGVSGSDFAFTQAALAYVYQRRPEHGLGPYSLNVTAGQTWYGGDPYLKFLR
ncbi:MAG: hypothetical protein LJE68_17320, partial [Rhodobacter sp.]|nr:hypothetical protein [Rhodobacter sp.]